MFTNNLSLCNLFDIIQGMEILKDIKQIEDKLKKIFGFEIEIDAERFIRNHLSDFDLNYLAENAKAISKDNGDIDGFSDLIFQLRDYMFALSNFIKLLLILKDYEAVFHFMKKIFVGQIGQIKYSSTKETYTYLERYFDRFVEIVKNCDIEKTLYLPLILQAFQSDKTQPLFNWKRPAIEFMQNFFNENEDWTLEYINSNLDNKYKLLEMITDFNTARGIKMLIDDFIAESNFDEEQNSHILKKYKRETFLELDKRLLENISDAEKERLTAVFLSFGKDNEALTRLKDLYDRSVNENLKNIIAERLEIIESPEVKTEKQFLYAARRKVKDPQERTLGIPFDKIDLNLASGFPANNVAKTHLINIFKEENNLDRLKNLNYLFDVFEPEGLNSFAEKLFDALSKKDDIKEAKWAVRFITLLGNDKLTRELIDFTSLLFAYNRKKEGKYLTECLVNAGKTEAIKIFNKIILIDEADVDWKREMLDELAKKADINVEDLSDQLAIGKDSYEEKEKQKKRLFNAFLNSREYNSKNFDILASNQPFKSLFDKLIWGEYKNDKLYNAFVLESKIPFGEDISTMQRKYLVRLLDENPENFVVSILHTLDIDDRFEKIINAIPAPLFEQFKKMKFDAKDYKNQTTEISNFNGMFIIANEFVEKIEKFGFKINRNEGEITFSSLIHLNEDKNLACILEFNKPVNLTQAYSNLGSIYFIKVTDLIKDREKYIYSKSNAISAPSLPARYFDYCMTAIVSSVQ